MTNSVFDQQPEFDVVALGELLVDFTQNGNAAEREHKSVQRGIRPQCPV